MDDTMMNDIVKTDVRQQILHGMSGVGKRFFKKGNFEKKNQGCMVNVHSGYAIEKNIVLKDIFVIM